MRAITVRQPWASAIARGEKDVENRSRNIVGSFRGPVAIHAAKGTGTLDEYGIAARRIASLTGFLPFATLPAGLGVVVAVGELVDAHRADECFEEDGRGCSPWGDRNCWHLCLEDVQSLREPVPAKGALGLWTLPADVEGKVLAQRPDLILTLRQRHANA